MGRGLLIIVSGLFIIYGFVQNSLNERQNTITRHSANYATETKAETIANTMADLAFTEIDKFATDDDETIGEFSERDVLGGRGSVNVTFDQPFAPSNPFIRHKVIMATGIYQGDTARVVVRAQRRAFSKYAYFTNRERQKNGRPIYFGGNDRLNGPVHTNERFYISGDPVFNGPVTSTDTPLGSGDPVYNGEAPDFNSSRIDMPVQEDLVDLADQANNGGLRFDEDIKIEFFNDNSSGSDVGKVDISTKEYVERCDDWDWDDGEKYCDDWDTVYDWGSPTTYTLSDYNGIISSSKKIEVEGTLNGDLTIHSEKDVEIMGDLRYKDDPRDKPDSDDFLGIVSEGDVKVDNDAHRDEGYRDVDIHASIMALGDSFSVEDYDQYGPNRGDLNLLGGLIQERRGIVLWRSGYNKNYSYDRRFLGRSPRGFPKTDEYDITSWRKLQKKESFNDNVINKDGN